MLNVSEITDYIKSLGVDLIGFTNKIDESDYLKRAEYKLHNNMLYPRHIDINDYINVNKYVSNAKSIISIGISYHQANIISNNNNDVYYSKISYGLDYHKVIYPILDKIANYLENYFDDFEYYYSCDTKELDDRFFAYSCGLGFYGKNTMLINEQYGSEVVYGTLITNLDLEIDDVKLLESKCNQCNLCEIACPTNSLANYYLDYRKCFSYLSQTKEMFSYKIAVNSIYGCDICNNVCPFNKNVKNTTTFIEDKGFIDINKLVMMSNKEYRTYFEDRSLLWVNKNIIKKNAVMLLKKRINDNDTLNLLNELRNKSDSKLICDAIDYIKEGD